MDIEGDTSGTVLRNLFGGALRCVMPASFRDVSEVRQVPDHQEVWVDKKSDVSIVVELLGLATGVGDQVGAKYFIEDLAEANEAAGATIDFFAPLPNNAMPRLPEEVPKSAAVGLQAVTKFRRPPGGDSSIGGGSVPSEVVRIFLVNVRLKSVGTDLLVTLNVP
ncbi:unnamed protein product, partial [Phaeothamnion confervicola]